MRRDIGGDPDQNPNGIREGMTVTLGNDWQAGWVVAMDAGSRYALVLWNQGSGEKCHHLASELKPA